MRGFDRLGKAGMALLGAAWVRSERQARMGMERTGAAGNRDDWKGRHGGGGAEQKGLDRRGRSSMGRVVGPSIEQMVGARQEGLGQAWFGRDRKR